jgi:hypothetical protein
LAAVELFAHTFEAEVHTGSALHVHAADPALPVQA